MTRDAARGETRILGIFERGFTLARLWQSLAGRTPSSPRLSRRARRSSVVCATRASGRLCGSTSAPTVRTTSSPRTAKKCDVDEDVDEDEEDPFTVLQGRRGPGRPHFPTAMAHRRSPRWRPLRQALCRAAGPARWTCALNAMRSVAWRSCVWSFSTHSTISRSSHLLLCQGTHLMEHVPRPLLMLFIMQGGSPNL